MVTSCGVLVPYYVSIKSNIRSSSRISRHPSLSSQLEGYLYIIVQLLVNSEVAASFHDHVGGVVECRRAGWMGALLQRIPRLKARRCRLKEPRRLASSRRSKNAETVMFAAMSKYALSSPVWVVVPLIISHRSSGPMRTCDGRRLSASLSLSGRATVARRINEFCCR